MDFSHIVDRIGEILKAPPEVKSVRMKTSNVKASADYTVTMNDGATQYYQFRGV